MRASSASHNQVRVRHVGGSLEHDDLRPLDARCCRLLHPMSAAFYYEALNFYFRLPEPLLVFGTPAARTMAYQRPFQD